MAAPKDAIRRFDMDLTYAEFNNAFNQGGFIGLFVFTPIPVGSQSAEFTRLPVRLFTDGMAAIDTTRAPGATYQRGTFQWVNDDYKTAEHGWEEPLDDRQRAIYGDALNQEQAATNRAVNIVVQKYEAAVAAAAQDTTSGDPLPNSAVATAWTNKSAADPIADVDRAKKAVRDALGMPANCLVLSDWALLQMIRTDRVEGLLKYSGVDDPKTLANLPGLRALLQLPYIFVGMGKYVDGQAPKADVATAASFLSHWDDTKATVCRIDPTPDIQAIGPRLGVTCMFSEENAGIPGEGDTRPEVIVEQYRSEEVRGDVVRARMDYQVKRMHKEAAHVLTGATA